MRTNQLTAVFILACLVQHAAFAQINYTANDFGHVLPYNGYFMYGTNGGTYGSSWDDKSISDIAAGNPALNVKGVGSKTFRPPLPENFLEYWGYDIRLNEFNHYQSLGVRDNTIILGIPSAAHKDNNKYGGCADESALFKNMYEPIWDGGANGTPVNDNNYYALYVYKTVTRYKSWAKFWEIVNEPDFDVASNGWKDPGQAGNWWDNNPSPCDLYNMKAPIFYYVRMLRISYEVIKSIDPSAYVATGGLGFVSFLDATLRNTDNPVDGSVTADYPLKGGAYFDVLSFHSYPMYNLAYWNTAINGWSYKRHSDAATDEYIKLKNSFEQVLTNYGYNGTTYPRKLFICTENNIAKKSFSGWIGTDEAQTNYIIKTLVASQQNDIRQLYVFVLGDAATTADATDPYQMMGLYQKLEGKGPYSNGGAYLQQYNNEGVAFKTTSDLLINHRYDATRTAAMNLPATIGGGAFRDTTGNYVYVLWAKTSTDQSELSTAVYTFPAALSVSPTLNKRQWNFSITNVSTSIGAANIVLTGSPIFLSDNFQPLPIATNLANDNEENERVFALSIYPNPAVLQSSLQFTLRNKATVQVNIYNAQGQWIRTAIPATSFASGTHVKALPVAQLPAGVYYCRFETETRQVMKKLVIKR